MSAPWEVRRTTLNHEELKNQFLNRLAAAVKAARAESEGERVRRFIAEDLSQWPVIDEEASWLLTNFEKEMSPRTLFLGPPLSSCSDATKAWLGDALEQVWQIRTGHREAIDKASSALADARASFLRLEQRDTDALALCGRSASPMSLAEALESFEEACRRLSAGLSKLPHRVEIL